MEKRFISFGDIEQFRNVILNVEKAAQYVSYNKETQEVVVDRNAKMPVVNAIATEKLHGCLKYDTLITTKEYGDIAIGIIIENNLDCNVLTFNHKTGENEWNPILNKWKSEDASKDWYTITTDKGQSITLTGNHKVWCVNKNEYIRCDKLTPTDIIQLR